MRKFWFLLILIFLSAQNLWAGELCPTAYELTSGLSSFMSRATGSNFIHTKLLEHYLEKQLAKKLPGKFEIQIDSFSTPDLKNGKFRSLTAVGENIILDELSISKATVNSICDFNRLEKTENSTYRFAEDFPANITIELSAADINQITQTTDYKRTIREINNILLGMLRIEDVKFDIHDNKLWYNFIFSTPFSPKKQAINIGTSLKLNAGDVSIITDQTSGKPTILSILNLTDALNFINPLDFSTKILENSIINASLNEIYASDNKIIIKAFINIRK